MVQKHCLKNHTIAKTQTCGFQNHLWGGFPPKAQERPRRAWGAVDEAEVGSRRAGPAPLRMCACSPRRTCSQRLTAFAVAGASVQVQVDICSPATHRADLPRHSAAESTVPLCLQAQRPRRAWGGMANVPPPGPPWRTCACCPRTACSLWLTASAVLGSSLLAQVMPILALWVTDRQEHELIVGAHQHSCYHCDVPQHLKDQPSPSKLVDAADVCAQPSTSKLVDAADVL